MPYGALSAPKITPALYRLKIELVPERAWGNNLRALLTDAQWDAVRKDVYQKAHYRCQICSGVGTSHPVECHELWQYEEQRHIQRLTGLQALCPLCHQCKHLGFADKVGNLPAVLEHLCQVNGITARQCDAYVQWAYAQQRLRARFLWQLDLGWFKQQYPHLEQCAQEPERHVRLKSFDGTPGGSAPL
jgi:hypothetical protein